MLGLQAPGSVHFFSYVKPSAASVCALPILMRLASASKEPGTLEAVVALLKGGCGVTRSMDLALAE